MTMSSSASLQTRHRPKVFDYLDYQQFVNDMLAFLKTKRISARSIAKKVGFGSPNYLVLIASKKRHLSSKTALLVAMAFKLEKPEALYFEKLVKYALAESLDEQNKIFRELQILIGSQNRRTLNVSEYSLYRDWRLIALYQAIPLKWAQLNRRSLLKSLSLSPINLESYLKHLETMGLIERSGMQVRKLDKTLEAPEATFHEDLRKFHVSLLEMALEKTQTLPLQDRHLGAVTLSLTKDQFDLLKKRIEEFKIEMNAEFQEKPDATAVYQLQIQLFPILSALTDHFIPVR